ncbi:hypothetical protein V1264_009879 [Littorina saxatilis]
MTTGLLILISGDMSTLQGRALKFFYLNENTSNSSVKDNRTPISSGDSVSGIIKMLSKSEKPPTTRTETAENSEKKPAVAQPESSAKPGAASSNASESKESNSEKKPTQPATAKPPQPTNRPMLCTGCFHSDFTILSHNPDVCAPSASGTTTEMIIMITSSPDGFDRRQAIRDTWASASKNNTGNIRHVFLLGTTGDVKVTEGIASESAKYRDVVVSDFVDCYANLTLKTLAGLHWIVDHCGQAKYFMKTDQDMYVFVNRILDLARSKEKTLMTSLGGCCYQTGKPWRDPKTKYYASIRSYPQPTYPGFCSGTGYISTLNVARKIVETSPNIPFFHLEDVYLALVMRSINYKLTMYEGFVAGTEACTVPSRAKRTYTIHDISAETIRKLWDQKCGV